MLITCLLHLPHHVSCHNSSTVNEQTLFWTCMYSTLATCVQQLRIPSASCSNLVDISVLSKLEQHLLSCAFGLPGLSRGCHVHMEERLHVHEHREAVKRALSCQTTALIMKTASQFKDGSVFAGYCRRSPLSGYQWAFLPLRDCSCTTLCFDSLSNIQFYSSVSTQMAKWISDCDEIIHVHSPVSCCI